eukprot:gene11513-biopygen2334
MLRGDSGVPNALDVAPKPPKALLVAAPNPPNPPPPGTYPRPEHNRGCPVNFAASNRLEPLSVHWNHRLYQTTWTANDWGRGITTSNVELMNFHRASSIICPHGRIGLNYIPC